MTITHAAHADHDHVHDDGCGHVAVDHDDHTDYLHEGHAHTHGAHEGHWDECELTGPLGRALSALARLSEGSRQSARPADKTTHQTAAARLGAVDQRYTTNRRELVEVLGTTERPLKMAEIVARTAGMPQSSAYRNLTVLCEARVARRLPGADDLGRFELAEDLSGHHHHLRCVACGALVDYTAASRLERALGEAARLASSESGFEITGHRVDFEGRCPQCRPEAAGHG